MTIITLAPHLCMPRTSHPHVTSLVMCWMLPNAVVGSGL